MTLARFVAYGAFGLGTALAACGGADFGAADAGPEDAGPSPGDGTASLEVDVQIEVDATDDAWDSASVRVEVDVEDILDAPVEGAEVLFGPYGAAAPLAGAKGTPGLYAADLFGYAPLWELSVVRGEDRLEGVRFAGPARYDVGVEPSPVPAGEGATVRWSPSDEAGVAAAVYVETESEGNTYFDDSPTGDDGEQALPRTAFPVAGTYAVTVHRRLDPGYELASPSSLARVDLADARTTAVE